MPILHVRNVPDEVYARLLRLADTQKRSLSAEVIALLEDALQEVEARRSQARTLAGIRRRRLSYSVKTKVPDSVVLLREDRAR